jgi:hypothetical protein
MRRLLGSACAAALVLVSAACDSVDPVAPPESVLTISVSPTFIELNGSATVTVLGRKSNGQPINKGSEVFFSTTLGTITQMAEADENGIANAILRGDGRAGEATVTATSGAASAAVSEPIQIGAFAAFITLQVTPSVVLEEGGTLDLLALVRDDRGALLPNAVVNFTSEFGILGSGGSGIVTNAQGEARDTLSVSAADVVAAGTQFTVTAQTGGGPGSGNLVTATFIVSVARLEPIASFSFTIGGPQNRTVTFNNESSGAEPLTFLWDFGDNTQSSQRNPVHQYNTGGQFTVRLTVTNQFGSDQAVATFNLQ